MRFGRIGGSSGWSFRVCALSFVVVVACDHPQDRERTAATTQAIQGGSDDGASHPYAVGVCVGGAKGACLGICSGALILPNLVVTARHCVEQTPKVIDCTVSPPTRFGASEGVNWVTTNGKMFQSTLGWHAVKNILVPPDDRVCGNDIALIVLSSPILASEAVPVIPGVQYPMGDIDRYPLHSYTAIGYGKISPLDPAPAEQCFTSSSNYAVCPGLRRIRGGIRLLCIPGDEYIPCPVDPALNDNEFIGDDGTCEGDSGSSAFETASMQDGKPMTFGVLSRGGESPDGLTCKQAVYTRLDKWRDFVVQTATTASANWTLYPKPVPDWTVYVPPPTDAGAPDTGPRATGLDDGVACDTSVECASALCADTGAGMVCAQACDESVPNTCGAGFVCQANVCMVASGAPRPTTTTTTSGCSAGRVSPRSGAPWQGVLHLAAIAGVIGLLRGARRRIKTLPDR